NIDPINLYAWLRRGELDFQAMNLPNYNEKGLRDWIDSREWKSHIEDVDYFKKLPSILSSFGVGLVFVPSLPKTVYGAIRWIDGKPLIQISDRGHDLISCWFTLFHEFGHAILHKDVEIYEGNINESKANHNKYEKEANKFANEYLFNGDNLRKTVFERKRKSQLMSANALAEEFNVKPILASYWLLKAQYAPAFQRKIPIDFTSQYQ
ncbi:MAG: ImmA/IrrE family metallo-endopeptidase, partial [Prevotellaceae bacterium]|nr:ImmA/IrrE family metallo-endopeptidase [Prevotellaceae bacterium]